MRRFPESNECMKPGIASCHHPTCTNGGSAKCRSVWKITQVKQTCGVALQNNAEFLNMGE